MSGPMPLIEYNGAGKATAVALAAGPDGLYFSDFYRDLHFNSPIDPEARILRICYAGLPGDANCDGAITCADINPFLLALGARTAYESAYPGCHWLAADCNGDGNVTYADINAFVVLLGP